MFCSENEAIIYRNLLFTKINENSDKIQFDTNQTRCQLHHLQMHPWE